MLLILAGVLLFFGGMLVCLAADWGLAWASLARAREEITYEEFYNRCGSYIVGTFVGKALAFVGLLLIHVNSLLLLLFRGHELSPNEKLGLLFLVALTMLLYVILLGPMLRLYFW